MRKAEAFEGLRRAPVLRRLPAGELDRLLSQSDLREFRPGERLAREGEQGLEVYVIARGRVSVRVGIGPREDLVIATRSEGDWVGEMALVDGGPRSATLLAEGPVTAVCIPRDVFLDTVAVSAAAELDMLRVVSRRLRESDAAQIDALRTKNQRLAASNEDLGRENRELRSRLGAAAGLAGFLGTSAPAERVRQAALRAAASDLAVLLLGETGTGKELVARGIHAAGSRNDAPFVALNCALFGGSLLEAELFGYARGAFTGAVHAKPGLVEEAQGGTLFLDEVADMPPPAQAALLRFLESGEFRRLGETRLRRTEVRLVAATSADLEVAEASGRLRRDLLYRLDVFRIEIPPLRERAADVPGLLTVFASKVADRLGVPALAFEPGAVELLAEYSFPGNVRELQNEVERLYAALGGGARVRPADLSPRVARRAASDAACGHGYQEALRGFKAELLRDALERADGNRARAARELGLHRSNFVRMLRQLGVEDDAGPANLADR